MPAFSSVTSLVGALRINYSLGLAGLEDLGGKVALLVSQVNALTSNVIILQSAAVSANVSAATFSSLSGVTFTVYANISNFSST